MLFGIVKISYLLFYLVSPFFHHHHDELIQGEVSLSYHSHLFDGTENGKEGTEYHHTFENDDLHNHPFLVRGVVTNITQNFTDTFLKIIPIFIPIKPEQENKLSWNNYPPNSDFEKIYRDKYVHSAGNVSPPHLAAS